MLYVPTYEYIHKCIHVIDIHILAYYKLVYIISNVHAKVVYALVLRHYYLCI